MKKYILVFSSLFLLFFISKQIFSYPRNMLVEFSTSTSCSHCPCMDSLVGVEIINHFPGTNAISYHYFEGLDPYANFKGKGIIGLLNLYALPTASVDRFYNEPIQYENIFSTASSRLANSPTTMINLNVVNKNYNSNSGELTITVNAITSENLNGTYLIQLLIYESNLIHSQNVGECGGGPTFIHNLVAREISNPSPYGDTLLVGNWNANQTISKSLSTTISSNWIAQNCKFIIAVYKLTTLETLVQSEILQSIKGNVTGSVGINNNNEYVKDLSLSQNYPNPFNPVTNIKFSIPKNEFVELKILDVLGKEVSILCKQNLQKGAYNVEFDASKLSSGTYFYTLKTKDFTSTKKMIIVK